MQKFNKIGNAPSNWVEPVRETEHSCGYDIKTYNDVVIKPNSFTVLNTYTSVEMGNKEFLMIVPRSSTGFKLNLMLINTVGIIDADYKDEIKVGVFNYGDKEVKLESGQKLVQGIFVTYNSDTVVTTKRTGGMGSTGK